MSRYDVLQDTDPQMMIYNNEDNLSDNMKRWCGWSKPANVIDKYRGLTVDEIKDDLQKNAFPYAVAMENVLGDFNMATMIRNANAFGVKDFYYVGGKRKFDRRGCVGSYIYTPPTHIKEISSFIELKNKYKFVAIDNCPGAVDIQDYIWEPNTLVVFGEEGRGISDELLSHCDDKVQIPMFGSVRSLNVGCASSIVMYDITNKLKK